MSNKKWEPHQAKDFSEKDMEAEIEEGLEGTVPSEENVTQRNEWEAKIAELTERLVRQQADADNREKRLRRDAAEAQKFGLGEFLKQLIPVIDSLELALSVPASGDSLAQKIHQGVEMTLTMLLNLAQKFDIEVINPLNQPFNSEFHEAVSVQEAAALGVSPNTVTNVFQKGYLLNGRLVRPAMVVVAK